MTEEQQRLATVPVDAVARFHINNGNYLLDVGQFLDALVEFRTAQEVAESAEIQAEALSSQAMTRALFLDNPAGALKDHREILDRFRGTAFYESSLFQAGMLAYQLQKTQDARDLFRRYLREFPEGAQKASAEFMVEKTEELIAQNKLPPMPPPPTIRKEISVQLGEWSAITVNSTAEISVQGSSADPLGTQVIVRRQGSQILLNQITAVPPAELSASQPMKIGGKTYRGRLRMYAGKGSGVMVVNRVSLEDYIASVVNSEMPASFPLEAQKAQAVASRTYALYHVQHPRQAGVFDVYDDPRSQAYGGISRETSRGRAAVAATAGEVLFHDKRPILAYFDSNNGGVTDDSECIFGEAKPYLQFLQDPLSRNEPWGTWERFFTAQEIRQALTSYGVEVGEVQDLQPSQVCPSGRIIKVTVVNSRGRKTLRTFGQLRSALNNKLSKRYQPDNLPDILMTIEKEGDGFRLRGGGWGHGVGMSQYGARARATQDADYKKILGAYYPSTKLEKVY